MNESVRTECVGPIRETLDSAWAVRESNPRPPACKAGASRIERGTAALVGTPYAAQEWARQSTAGPVRVPALTVERHRVVRTECVERRGR